MLCIFCYLVSNLIKMEEITAMLNDERVTHLWDKPNKQLSPRQNSVIRNACASQFSIIHGPPGIMCVLVVFNFIFSPGICMCVSYSTIVLYNRTLKIWVWPMPYILVEASIYRCIYMVTLYNVELFVNSHTNLLVQCFKDIHKATPTYAYTMSKYCKVIKVNCATLKSLNFFASLCQLVSVYFLLQYYRVYTLSLL